MYLFSHSILMLEFTHFFPAWNSQLGYYGVINVQLGKVADPKPSVKDGVRPSSGAATFETSARRILLVIACFGKGCAGARAHSSAKD
jgi:hypothetical protein